MEITKGNAYQIKLNNPTNENHELIIETQNKSKVGGRGNIKPGNNTKFEFEEMETHELNYYNEYHLETMKGILTMSETRQ